MELSFAGSSTAVTIFAMYPNTAIVGWANQGAVGDVVYFTAQGAFVQANTTYLVNFEASVGGVGMIGLALDGVPVTGSSVGAVTNINNKLSGAAIVTVPSTPGPHLLTIVLSNRGAYASAPEGTGSQVANMTVIALESPSNYAFAYSTDNTTQGNGGPVPIGDWNYVVSSGSAIQISSNGAVLQPGTYLIRYNANMISIGRGAVAMGLVLNGTPVPGSVHAGYPSDESVSEQLSGVAIVSVSKPDSLLDLAIWPSNCYIAVRYYLTSAQMTVITLKSA